MNGLALCAGVGGLELGLHLALGDAYRTICFVEREAHAAAILVARMGEGILAPAPVWDDLTSFDGHGWRGVVHLVSAGYPCQPFSFAGRRDGVDDARHLWPHVSRIVSECGPATVFLENVPGHLSLGFDAVCADLSGMGYRVAACVSSSAEVGATHRRERLFVMAERAGGSAWGAGVQSSAPDDLGPLAHRNTAGAGLADEVGVWGTAAKPIHHGESVAHADASGCGTQQRHDHESGRQLEPDGGGPSVGHANLARLQGRGGPEREGAYELPTRPPGPSGDWSGIPEWLHPAVAYSGRERRQQDPGRPSGDEETHGGTRRDGGESDGNNFAGSVGQNRGREATAESSVRGMADGLASRVDRLRACGNGVDPLVAAHAFRTLAAELVTP